MKGLMSVDMHANHYVFNCCHRKYTEASWGYKWKRIQKLVISAVICRPVRSYSDNSSEEDSCMYIITGDTQNKLT
jgi:hypothetical protein